MKSVITWLWVSIPTAVTVTMHSDRLALSSASCMVNAPTAHGQNDVQIQDEGSSLSKLQINNQELRAGTFIAGIGQGEGAAGGLTIATRRALLPSTLTTLPAVVPTSTDSMSAQHTTSTVTHDLRRGAAQEKIIPVHGFHASHGDQEFTCQTDSKVRSVDTSERSVFRHRTTEPSLTW